MSKRTGWLAKAVESLIRKSLEQALASRARAQDLAPTGSAGSPANGHAKNSGVATPANLRQSGKMIAEPVSFASTQGIEITVRSQFLPEQSSPKLDRYVFAYTVSIANRGSAPAQLKTRHWVITDGRGSIEEVRGDGVVGEQPHLQPGQTFQYTSGCVLATSVGTMHGTYRMFRDDGSHFDADIAPFSLATPGRTQSASN